MKRKLLVSALICTMCVSAFTGCGKKEPVTIKDIDEMSDSEFEKYLEDVLNEDVGGNETETGEELQREEAVECEIRAGVCHLPLCCGVCYGTDGEEYADRFLHYCRPCLLAVECGEHEKSGTDHHHHSSSEHDYVVTFSLLLHLSLSSGCCPLVLPGRCSVHRCPRRRLS